MFKVLAASVRERWHPLWRLRRLGTFRRFQDLCDRTVYTRIPDTGLRVAVRLLRDATWIVSPASLEPEIRKAFSLVLDLLKPSTFWDVGANIGFYSWVVRQSPSVRQVVMFEPDPANFALIVATIRKNRLSDCQPLNLALSDQLGEASFMVDRASGATGSLESTAHPENATTLHHAYQMSDTITCRTATVDGLIIDGVPAPEFMKIDVEGAESLVLAGAQSCLKERRPAMIIETGNAELVDELLAIGYAAFRIDQGNLLFLNSERLDLASVEQAFPQYGPVSSR